MDWIGKWFTIAEKIYNEKLNIIFTEHNTDTKDKIDHIIPHSQSDGYNGYIDILKNKFEIVTPRLNKYKRINAFMKIISIIRFLTISLEKNRIDFKFYNYYTDKKEQDMQFYIFNINETQRIKNIIDSKNLSLTNYLLYKLNNVVKNSINNTNKTNIWMLPILMAGNLDTIDKNLSCYLKIKLNESDTEYNIMGKISKAFKKNEHWGAWYSLNLGKLTGDKGLYFFVNYIIKNNLTWTGSFSNLGKWYLYDTENKIIENRVWFGCPPVTKNQPIGSGSIIWNDKLIISSRVHPVIENHEGINKTLMNSWTNLILSDII